MSVIDDVLGKEPEYRTAEFCIRHDLREEWVRAKQAVSTAEVAAARATSASGAEPRRALADARAALEDLRERVGPAMIRFTFRSVERVEFDAVKGANRPTEAQRTDARKNQQPAPEWGESFQPALVAAACTTLRGPSGEQDHLTVEEANAIWSSPNWNEAERAELFHTALAAYVSRTEMAGVNLGNG